MSIKDPNKTNKCKPIYEMAQCWPKLNATGQPEFISIKVQQTLSFQLIQSLGSQTIRKVCWSLGKQYHALNYFGILLRPLMRISMFAATKLAIVKLIRTWAYMPTKKCPIIGHMTWNVRTCDLEKVILGIWFQYALE